MADQRSSPIGAILLIAGAIVLYMLYKNGTLSGLLKGLGGSGTQAQQPTINITVPTNTSSSYTPPPAPVSTPSASSKTASSPSGWDGTPYSEFTLAHAPVGQFGSQYDAAQQAAAAAWDAAHPTVAPSQPEPVSKPTTTVSHSTGATGFDGTPYSLFMLSHTPVGQYGAQYDAAQRAAVSAWVAQQKASVTRYVAPKPAPERTPTTNVNRYTGYKPSGSHYTMTSG
jgi:hypothetical protein